MISEDRLREELEALERDYQKLESNLIAVDGAIQVVKKLLDESASSGDDGGDERDDAGA